MKKFDLEAAKAGAPICTRSGKSARIICWDRKTEDDEKLIVLINLGSKEDYTAVYTDGKLLDDGKDSDYDLFMVTTHHTGYAIIYRKENTKLGVSPFVYSTYNEAEREALLVDNVVSIAKVTWEE